jgi:uncharacterized YigZ family protein
MSRTLAAPASHEALIKRSRFIAHAARCGSEDQAREFLASVADPTATHNCWAWRSGQQYRFDDDGEPGGTAGRPILQAIEGQEMDQVAVVVIRYYGGIKLGTGGLARAYGGTAAECLRTARHEAIVPTKRLRCRLPFEAIALAHQLIERHQAQKLAEDYASQGIELSIELPAAAVEAFETELRNATSGAATIAQMDE